MDFAAVVGGIGDRGRGQNSRSDDIPVPRDPQAVTKLLMKPQPEGAGSESHVFG